MMKKIGYFLVGGVGALFDLLWEFFAVWGLMGVISPRLRGEPLDWGDVVFPVLLVVCLAVLVMRARSEERTIEARFEWKGGLTVPTISIFHYLSGAGWIALGIYSLQPPGDANATAWGGACIAVSVVLIITRSVILWRRQR